MRSRTGRRPALLVVALVGLFVLGPTAVQAATPGPRSVDEIAEALSADPILVDPVLGTGDAAGVHDVLTELAAEVDVPVFVVLAPTPPELRTTDDPAQQAAALLHATLGDGLYFVHFTDGIGWVGGFGAARDIDTGPGQRAYTRAREVGPYDFNQRTAALEAELILRSAADPGREIDDDRLRELIDTPRAFVPTEARDRPDRLAQRWVMTIATAVAVVVAAAVLIPVAAANPLRRTDKPSGRTGRPGRPAQQVDRSAAGTVLGRARSRYDTLQPGQLASPHATAAAEALTAADLVIDTGDRLDVIGAWVLAQQADRELKRLRRSSQVAYRPCVVNPEHGEASATVRLAGSSLDAPACQACRHGDGDVLTVRTWRGERPYLDTSTVWARTGFGALVDDLARQVIADRTAR